MNLMGIIIEKAVPALPAGAIGIWKAADYIAATKTIPNSANAGTRDQNIFMAPRRQFTNGQNQMYWGVNLATIADEAATAPDGSNDASTVATASSVDWFVQAENARQGTQMLANGAAGCMAISVKYLGGGSANFRFGDNNSTVGTFTANGSWQRFTQPFTSTGNMVPIFRAPTGGSVANFAICDWQIFPGSADLNPNPLSAAPQSVINADLILNRDQSAPVSGGALQHLNWGMIQFPTQQSSGAFTLLYVAKKNGASTSSDWDPVMSVMPSNGRDYSTFSVGPLLGQKMGTMISGAMLDAIPIDSSVPQTNDTIFGEGGGPFVAAHRYDGAAASTFINGVKILDNAIVRTPTSWKDVAIGTLGFVNGTSFPAAFDFNEIVYYGRALSDAEIKTRRRRSRRNSACQPMTSSPSSVRASLKASVPRSMV